MATITKVKSAPASQPATVYATPAAAAPVSYAPILSTGGLVALVLGAAIGMGFTGYVLKTPAPIAHAIAPVTGTIDYAAITAAVKAGFPVPAVAASVPVPAPKLVPVTVVKTVTIKGKTYAIVD